MTLSGQSDSVEMDGSEQALDRYRAEDAMSVWGPECELVIEINGCIYYGDRLDAYVAAVKWLRANPERAALLLNWGAA